MVVTTFLRIVFECRARRRSVGERSDDGVLLYLARKEGEEGGLLLLGQRDRTRRRHFFVHRLDAIVFSNSHCVNCEFLVFLATRRDTRYNSARMR